MVSLQMCFMGWLFELIAIVFACLAPLLHHFEIPNLHMIDCTMMFVLIPFFHLLNDEKTNGIISDENWYQGMRHLLGIYIPPKKRKGNTQPNPIPNQIGIPPILRPKTNHQLNVSSQEIATS